MFPIRTVRFGYLFSVLAFPDRAVPVHSVPVRFMAFMEIVKHGEKRWKR